MKREGLADLPAHAVLDMVARLDDAAAAQAGKKKAASRRSRNFAMRAASTEVPSNSARQLR
jgi:hypothetical protein